MYFLDNEDAVSERMNNPINHGISKDLLDLLEHILRSVNPFVNGYMIMREIEEEANLRAIAEGEQPPYIKLPFALLYKRYDSMKDTPVGALQFTTEFLNTVELDDLPPHELRL